MKNNYNKILEFENPFLDYNLDELVEFYRGYKNIQSIGWCTENNPLRSYLNYYNYKNFGGITEMCRQLLVAIAEKALTNS